MRNLFAIHTLSLLLTLSAYASGPVILVTDIDDTIKVSHVLDKDSALANVSQKDNAFLGMPQLYRAMVQERKVDQVFYLSNAPARVMTVYHQRFLASSGFPSGVLLLKEGADRDHKVSSLRTIIRKQKPRELILIGDNGERDTEFYAQIVSEHPGLKITTFIRHAYSVEGFDRRSGKPLERGQLGFASSIDLAEKIGQRGYLSAVAYERLALEIIPRALTEGKLLKRGLHIMFPAWLDCRDYRVEKLYSTPATAALVQSFEIKLQNRCTRVPFGG